jgi:hypothetical protein
MNRVAVHNRLTQGVLMLLLISGLQPVYAQPAKGLVMKDTRQESRTRLYQSLVKGINRNLSLTPADSSEENWMDALYSMELLQYRTAWTEQLLRVAFSDIHYRSVYFQRSLAEAVYALYPSAFSSDVQQLFRATHDPKLTAICAEYLLRSQPVVRMELSDSVSQRLAADTASALLQILQQRLGGMQDEKRKPPISALLSHSFGDSTVVLFSIQRSNRDYPGLVIIRGRDGRFLRDPFGNLLYFPQLARSISNLPGYLSNGNTPQGIFRMKGFGVSKSIFIGPTPNLQLSLPVESSVRHFLRDSTRADTIWHRDKYRQLLPAGWQLYRPIFEAWYAGAAGRTEIIAHGTTVDPSWYRNLPCYPLTPTLGCLCTKEIWHPETGIRLVSDQQQLADAVLQAGGADGYLVVVELDNQLKPVEPAEIIPYIQ